MLQADEVSPNTVDNANAPREIVLVEIHPGHARQDFDPDRGTPIRITRPLHQEQLGGLTGRSEAEPAQDLDELVGVDRSCSNPNIQITCGAGISVVADGLSSDQEVLNLP
jgi:hypothetical protein